MFPDLTTMVVLARLDDLRREAERDRLAEVARQTTTAYRDRRMGFRRLLGAAGELRPFEGIPRKLVRKPAV